MRQLLTYSIIILPIFLMAIPPSEKAGATESAPEPKEVPPGKPESKNLLETVLETFKNNPYLAATVVVFVLLNALLGVFDKVLSILPKLGMSGSVDEAARQYAIFLAVSGALTASLYYIILTVIRFNEARNNALDSLLARCGIFEHSISYEVIPIVVACIFLNFAGSIFNRSLDELFFLDTLGTFLAACLLGPYWAGSVGLLSNFSMMMVSRNAFVWGIINATLGIVWGAIAKKSPSLLTNDKSRLRPIAGRIAIFLIPSVLLSTYISSVIRTAIYNPNEILLFSGKTWVAQKYILKALYEPGHISLKSAYLLGDFARNLIDKLLTITVGIMILAARALRLRKALGEEYAAAEDGQLPLRDRGRGSNLVFITLSIVFLYFVLPYEYVLDRAQDVRKQVHLGFASWFFLSLPLYMALFDLIFHPETGRCVIDRTTAKRQRMESYRARFQKARSIGLFHWMIAVIATSWAALVIYFIPFWAISLSEPSFNISQLAFSLLSVGVGLAAIIVLSFLGWLEKD